jgi:hypothetical protein
LFLFLWKLFGIIQEIGLEFNRRKCNFPLQYFDPHRLFYAHNVSICQ